MPYTDRQGRPEIVADPALKRGPAAYRIEDPAPAAGSASGDAERTEEVLPA
jgi:hypothetical protein